MGAAFRALGAPAADGPAMSAGDPTARRNARRRLEGASAVAQALEGGEPVRRVVVPEGELPPDLEDLCRRAAAAHVPVERAAPRRRERVAGAADAVAFVGPDPDVDLDTAMSRGGAVWLLVGAAYPGNVGGAVRTAEVSGADAVYVDNDFDHAQRRDVRRASMRADRALPLGWERAGVVIGAARRAGKRIVGVEDTGPAAPWDVDLRGPVLLVVGGEARGIPATVLRRCDAVVRIPTAGFVSSYNMGAALAALAAERLRQEATAGA